MGVLSLSKINNDLKMWGFYADSNRGVAICFNPSHPFFSDIQKVKYINNRLTFNINDIAMGDKPKLEDLYCIKSLEWKFEQEYRKFGFFENCKKKLEGNDSYGYPIYLFDVPKEALSGIILGNKIDEKNSTKIRDIIQNMELDVFIKQARISKNEYKIIID